MLYVAEKSVKKRVEISPLDLGTSYCIGSSLYLALINHN